MKGEIILRARVRQELIEIFQRHTCEAGVKVARRFQVQANAAFARLARMPGPGTRYEADNPAFGEVRFFPLAARFKSYMVFYRPMPDGIELARVLHGARDIPSILVEEFGPADDDDLPVGETESWSGLAARTLTDGLELVTVNTAHFQRVQQIG